TLRAFLQRAVVGREGPDLLVGADIDDVAPGEVAVLGRGSPPLHFAVVDDAVQALHLDGGQVALADEAAGAGEYPHVAGVRIAGQREAGGDRLRRVGVVARLEHGLARVGHLPVAAARTGQVELPQVALQVAGVDVVHAPVAVVVPAARREQAVGPGRPGLDLGDLGAGRQVQDEQRGASVGAVDAVADHHRLGL